ncbi:MULTISPECIES: TetR/AcrR family transcriptional regulator [unclassified Nonomuraea]|uniref:TetR/AcrR family transcriptional regulator n=1 Tax=unclassified Nonomuraea TaxID=2593643 RepID=UPI00273BF299|nr:TetR/AcrR family transcriptional regulator [Nonomuraea sp. G32]MDP4503538.1 TetR/AcrR family transcriptional regulator [Nonomuraea sp. G32]
MSAETLEGRRPSAARTRVLDTAARLFYREGVHTVGIDRIIAEADVAKATFYKHFPSKDDLVRAYVTEQSARQRAAAATMQADSPREKLMGIFAFMCEFGAGPTYRGCPFVNTAAEYPDPGHPVRQAIAEYRRWVRDLYRDLLAADGHPDAERTADILLLLRDGLVVGFDLDDPARVRAALLEALDRVLGA